MPFDLPPSPPAPLFEQVAEPDTRTKFVKWLEDPAPQTWFHFEQEGYKPKKPDDDAKIQADNGHFPK